MMIGGLRTLEDGAYLEEHTETETAPTRLLLHTVV
jgi:hypothetical protein